MKVGDEDGEVLALVLQAHAAAHGTEVVAHVQRARRLHARHHAPLPALAGPARLGSRRRRRCILGIQCLCIMLNRGFESKD